MSKFPDVTFPPDTDMKMALDKLQRWIQAAMPHWRLSGVPTGTIMAYSGYTSDCPSGWAVCDGTNGTPDLTASFIS